MSSSDGREADPGTHASVADRDRSARLIQREHQRFEIRRLGEMGMHRMIHVGTAGEPDAESVCVE